MKRLRTTGIIAGYIAVGCLACLLWHEAIGRKPTWETMALIEMVGVNGIWWTVCFVVNI